MNLKNIISCPAFLLIIFISSGSHATSLIETITFGSCLHQNKAQPIWQAINGEHPDVFIFMGDNIYADTRDPDIMREKYQRLANKQGYDALQAKTKVLATWDDHDYGVNDSGLENPIKQQAQAIFQDFFKVSETSPSRSTPGIYSSHYFTDNQNTLQIILLDTRFFRTTPVKLPTTDRCSHTHYGKQTDTAATILGNEQWQWLEKELKKPASLRLLISSIQIIPDQHCWEKWSNFPLEHEKLFDLLIDTQATNVVFLSGDRHLAEISKYSPAGSQHKFYEVTASGMNTKMYGAGEKNRFRITQDNFRENNYGVINIDWSQTNPIIKISLKNKDGKIWHQETLTISAQGIVDSL